MNWVAAFFEFLVLLLRGFLSEKSRDAANQDAGAAKARQSSAEEALQRAKDAKEISENVSRDSDDALDDRMRRNRERYIQFIRNKETHI
jgi:hypothetical protein